MWRGWISGDRSDESKLLELGIKLGPYNEEEREWTDCTVSDDAMEGLQEYWMTDLVWGLQPVCRQADEGVEKP